MRGFKESLSGEVTHPTLAVAQPTDAPVAETPAVTRIAVPVDESQTPSAA
jgi:hypothetical protein